MEKFRDITGEEFSLRLTLDIAMEIEAYDFQGMVPKIKLVPPDENLFNERIGDGKVCFGIAWCLIQKQIKDRLYKNPEFDAEKPVSDTNPERVLIREEMDFASRFDGKSLLELKKAVWQELTSFFPEATTTLRNLIRSFTEIQEEGIRRGNKLISERLSKTQIDKLWDEVEQKLDEDNLMRQVGSTSGDSGPLSNKIGDPKLSESFLSSGSHSK